MDQLWRAISPDSSGWLIIGGLTAVFVSGYCVARYVALAFRALERAHGVIAVYAPTAIIRKLAWDAVRRLHAWNAARILRFPTSRTSEDSAFAAAVVVAQQATRDTDSLLQAASEDPTLADHSALIESARAESKSIRAQAAGR